MRLGTKILIVAATLAAAPALAAAAETTPKADAPAAQQGCPMAPHAGMAGQTASGHMSGEHMAAGQGHMAAGQGHMMDHGQRMAQGRHMAGGGHGQITQGQGANCPGAQAPTDDNAKPASK